MTEAKIDLDFILKDCHGDVNAAQRRIDRVLNEVKSNGIKEGMERAAKVAECCPGACNSNSCNYCRTAREIRTNVAKDSAS